MNTIFKSIPAYVKLPYESSNAAIGQGRIVHLRAAIKPGPQELKDTMMVHFEVPAQLKSSFVYLVFRLQNMSTEWIQTTPENWAATRVGSIDTSHVFLCVKYL